MNMSDTSSPYALPKLKSARGARTANDALTQRLRALELDIEAGRLAESAQTLNELSRAHPRDARVFVAGWLLGMRANNPNAALQAARRAVELSPGSATAHYCKADAHRALGDNAAARLSVEQAIILMPNNLQYRELAVNLANAEADHAAAEKHLRAAYAQKRDIPGIRSMVGNALRYQSKFDEAKQWLSEALAVDGDDADAHHGLAMIAYQRDDLHNARIHLADALRVRPDDDGFRYLEAVFEGKTPEQQPEGMTRGLFDRYATRFDSHLVGALKYRVPQMVTPMILANYPDRRLNILDLGCGTGLLGAALGAIDGYFVGVDLSRPMLEEAQKHGVYARLHHVNLLDALEATEASEYEVIVAADVFVYLGALDVAIRDACKVLKPGGWLYFSVESAPADGPDFTLGKTMRYAHNPGYLRRLLDANGFVSQSMQDIDLRLEQDTVIRGHLVAAQKPA